MNSTAKSSPQRKVNGMAPSSGGTETADDSQVRVLPSHVESPDKIFVQLSDTSALNR